MLNPLNLNLFKTALYRMKTLFYNLKRNLLIINI